MLRIIENAFKLDEFKIQTIHRIEDISNWLLYSYKTNDLKKHEGTSDFAEEDHNLISFLDRDEFPMSSCESMMVVGVGDSELKFLQWTNTNLHYSNLYASLTEECKASGIY
jgi:hypothetical protein